MAAGEDKGGDPIERAMRRKAEAEVDKSTKRDSVVGTAMDRAAAKPKPASVPFEAPKREGPPKAARTYYEPLSAERYEPSLYQPDEGSFFAPSADERAEQARRAAQRVRRRVKGEEPEPSEPEAGSPPPAPEPKRPVPPVAAPEAKPERQVSPRPSLMDRAAEHPAPPKRQEPKAEPPTEVASKGERRREPVMPEPAQKQPDARGSEPKSAPRTTAADLIARSAERAASRAPDPTDREPSVSVPTFAKAAVAVPLVERVTGPAKAKPTATITAPAAKRTATAPPAKASVVQRVQAPAPKQKPIPAPVSAPVNRPKPVPDVEPVADDFEAVYAKADSIDSVYAEDTVVVPTSAMKTARTRAFAPFEWMIASRYLRARKKEGFVSVIAGFSLVGIALGVATLIVVMAVMTGFRETLITQIIGGSPHINVSSQIGPFENYDDVAERIRTVDGVEYVTPVVQGQVLGTGNQRHSGVLVRGLRKADLQHLIDNAEPEVINGSLEDFTGDNGLALGANLAAKLGLRVGDFVTLISPDGDITPFQATPMPRVKDYRIVQTFRLGVQEIDYNVAFMPFEEAQIYFNKKNQADTLDVFVDEPQLVSDRLDLIAPGSYEDQIFNSARSSISVNNWKNLNGRLIGAINLERQVMFVILTMIILVAALNIISGLVMLVKDKARDVAIMRTMGMARGSILRIFFICGSSIGVIGSIAGVILGVLFVWNIHAIQGGVEWITGTTVWDPSVRAGISEIPTKLQLSDVALTLFIALGLSFIATLFPAWKAAKLDPVEALRYE